MGSKVVSKLASSSRRQFLISLAGLAGAAAAACAGPVTTSPPGSAGAALTANTTAGSSSIDPIELLNVSYDPTRKLYKDYGTAFARYWQEKTGQTVSIKMS